MIAFLIVTTLQLLDFNFYSVRSYTSIKFSAPVKVNLTGADFLSAKRCFKIGRGYKNRFPFVVMHIYGKRVLCKKQNIKYFEPRPLINR